METPEMMKKRIGAFAPDSLPHGDGFSTRESRSLLFKVNKEGELLPFWGNTVVFLLDGEACAWVKRVQDELYKACADMLCTERLCEDTFHMTLHDLQSGASDSDIFGRVNDTREQALSVLAEVRAGLTEPIHMRPTWVFNMVNTSIVLGLEPMTEDDCTRLMAAYERFHEVTALPYPYLTPHITLAYYRPDDFDAEQLNRLRGVLVRLSGAEKPVIELRSEALMYQEFGSMNRYRTVV